MIVVQVVEVLNGIPNLEYIDGLIAVEVVEFCNGIPNLEYID